MKTYNIPGTWLDQRNFRGTKMDFTCKSLELAECRSRGSQTSTKANVHYTKCISKCSKAITGCYRNLEQEHVYIWRGRDNSGHRKVG